MKLRFKNKGFSLIEIIVAIGVIISVFIGSIALISFTISSTRVARSKTMAIGLAQEGLEIVRNIRDNNWLNYKRKVSNWRDGLSFGDWRVQYNNPALISFVNAPLQINTSGFYGYNGIAGFSGGTDTPFSRKITLEYIGNNQLKVISEVTWQERGINNSVKAETRLYNWLEEPEE